jgi:hypothetical protein
MAAARLQLQNVAGRLGKDAQATLRSPCIEHCSGSPALSHHSRKSPLPRHRPWSRIGPNLLCKDCGVPGAVNMPPPLRTGGSPVTNIRNTSSPHWRGWLKPESSCLVPFNSFAEYAPEPNPETKKKDVVWFALDDDRPLCAFAGIWTEFKGDRGTKSKPIPGPHLV